MEISLCASVYGDVKALLTVKEHKGGQCLIINRRTAPFLGHLGPKGPPITNAKLSVWANDSGYVLVHGTTRHGGPNGPHETHYRTDAVFKRKQFAHVYTRQFPDLSKFPTKSRAKNQLVLFHADPRFALTMGVFVGSADRQYQVLTSPAWGNLHQLHFSRFSLVVLWAFCPLRPDGTSDTVLNVMQEDDSDYDDALTEERCWEQFFENSQNLAQAFALRREQLVSKNGLHLGRLGVAMHIASMKLANASRLTEEWRLCAAEIAKIPTDESFPHYITYRTAL